MIALTHAKIGPRGPVGLYVIRRLRSKVVHNLDPVKSLDLNRRLLDYFRGLVSPSISWPEISNGNLPFHGVTLLADDRRRARIHVREILKSAFLYSWNARGETR